MGFFKGVIGNLFGVPVERRGGVPVNLQDQTTPAFDLFALQALGPPTTLTVTKTIGDRVITVADPTNFAVGVRVGIFTGVTGDNRFYFGEVLGVSGSDITLDTPLDYTFLATTSNVIAATRNMAVNGAVTPSVFEIKGPGTGSPIEVDITNIRVVIEAAAAVNLNTFGNLAALTNGLVLRRVDGDYRNVWNVKTNGQLASVCHECKIFEATNPAQAVDGLIARYDLAGQENHGVTVRLGANDSIQLIVQDDLSSLVRLNAIAQGHIVTD
ncbi:MAG: hypothetical protein ACYTBJ_15090 [Planctomycetota bacterium]|jgi:hypothetical protein